MIPQASGRRLLLAGFGGLLLLMIIAGVDAMVVLRQVHTKDALERDSYLRRAAALDEVRTGIYQSAIEMRAYLLAPNARAAGEQLAMWASVRKMTDAALQGCSTLLDTHDLPQLAALHREVEEYWRLLDYLAKIPETDRRLRGGNYLNQEMSQRRGATLEMVDRIDQMNARQMAASDVKLNENFDMLRLRLALMLAATLLVGLVLAIVTSQRTLQLETELEQRYQEGVTARRELKELSARLVSAQEEERRAISRELHDEVGQSLSALLMEAGNAAAHVPPETEVRRHVDSIKKLAEASVNVIRNMTLLLRPSMLDDFGLVPALEWQAREVYKRTGLRVHVSADDGAPELPDNLKTCVYRVVQEALHNCTKHSQAKSVKVIVEQEHTRILLTVEDDGQGFDSRRVRGLGLVGMEERVNHLGGTFAVLSKPGAGTKLEVELPLAS